MSVEPANLRMKAVTADDDVGPGLSLVFQRLSPGDRQRHVEEWAATIAAGGATLWTAQRGESLAAAAIAQIHPGRSAIVVAPDFAAQESAATAAQLLVPLIGELSGAGVRIAHSLLATDAGPQADALVQSGFHHAADLLYVVSLADAFPGAEPSASLQFTYYDASQHERMAAIVERTYAGSLDCPELDKMRSIEDVLTGYRAIGAFDQRRWMFVRDEKGDTGCLLLAEQAHGLAWELVYFGIVPEARGRKLGVAILRHAQWLARQAGCSRLTAAVDAANAPAIAAYAEAGFVSWDRRSVYLRVL